MERHISESGQDDRRSCAYTLFRFNEITDDTLILQRGECAIELPRGEKIADPESQVELINILDRSTKIVTMGALLSLRNDEYTVVGVYSDRISVRHHKTEDEFDVVGFADGEREAFFEGFKE